MCPLDPAKLRARLVKFPMGDNDKASKIWTSNFGPRRSSFTSRSQWLSFGDSQLLPSHTQFESRLFLGCRLVELNEQLSSLLVDVGVAKVYAEIKQLLGWIRQGLLRGGNFSH